MSGKKSKICTIKIGHQWVYGAILFSTLLWCLLFISVPFLACGGPFSRKIAGIITLFFAPICHQSAERSFHLMNHPFAVCARCTGIYGGFLAGVLLYPALNKWKKDATPSRGILIGAILLSGLEILLSRISLIPAGPLPRVLTGFILGSVMAFYVIPTVFELAKIQKGAKPKINSENISPKQAFWNESKLLPPKAESV